MQIQDDMQTLKQAYRFTDIPAKLKSTEYNLDLTEVTVLKVSLNQKRVLSFSWHVFSRLSDYETSNGFKGHECIKTLVKKLLQKAPSKRKIQNFK